MSYDAARDRFTMAVEGVRIETPLVQQSSARNPSREKLFRREAIERLERQGKV